MQSESKKFLYKLLNTPSPSGYEQRIQRVVRTRMSKYADTIETDLHGNVIVGVNTRAKLRVMLAGHCDQIGFMVTHISEKGFIYVAPLGGIDTGVLPGSHVTIFTEKGEIKGVIGRKPIHLQSEQERGRAKIEIGDVWIDVGAKSRKEIEKIVQIGDPATFTLGITELRNGMVASPGLDDKVGLFVAMEALRLCAKANISVALYAVSTVQEEVGLRGARTAAYGIDPTVGIAIDVTHAFDNPGGERKRAASIALGKGPCVVRGPNVNPVVEKRLIAAAKKAKIAYQLEPNSRPLSNDANALQVNRAGVAAASIGIPNRYMHTQSEVCSLKDLEDAAKMLAEFVKQLGAKSDFRPK
ncbi:MAG: M42 family metallopeptidase [Bdellovibrionales bacterium]|nr:M42 family metallopeptidase [Bdellovibrionales bacterium]